MPNLRQALAATAVAMVVTLFSSRAEDAGRPIAWEHPALELFLAGVSEAGDRARVELCVRTHPGVREGSVAVGFPRFRATWGRWTDGPIQGIDRSRSLRVLSASGPACFAVLVPWEATALLLPIGGRALELDIGGWLGGGDSQTASVSRGDAGLAHTVEDAWDRDEEDTSRADEPSLQPKPPAPVSDVDRAIPRSERPRPNALAVVLGVEMYSDAPPAAHAAADARTAARYFEHVLGIPIERIATMIDHEVTLGQLQRLFGADGWLARRVASDSEIFVFFAGHGLAELEKFAPYLLPADGDPDYLRQTALPLDRMIEMIAALGARRATVFLDSCFGGRSREGTALLAGARSLVLVQSKPTLAGISVYSAASRNQIASALDEQGHGLFSYYLFKGLGGEADLDHDRRIVADELKRYLEDAVPRAAKALDREQFPAIALDDAEQILVQLP